MSKRKKPVRGIAAQREAAIAEHRDVMLSNSLVTIRRYNADFPADVKLESLAIGAAIVAPHEHAAKLLGKAQAGIFFCRDYAWIWKQLQDAVKSGVNFDRELGYWLARRKVVHEFRRAFGYSLLDVIETALNAGFWWHGNYYIDRVIEIAKKRTRIIKAASELQAALGL